MDYEKAYKELVGKIEKAYLYAQTDSTKAVLEEIRPELKESMDEKIRKALINLFKIENFNGYTTLNGIDVDDVIAWLEKQGQQPKKVSIWKHWKDGIAGGAEGEQIFLTKIGRIYSISSCLGCECDYIELSELDSLLRDKQAPKPKWSEEDETMMNHCIGAIHIAGCHVTNSYTAKDKKAMKDWLKSLKQRKENEL